MTEKRTPRHWHAQDELNGSDHVFHTRETLDTHIRRVTGPEFMKTFPCVIRCSAYRSEIEDEEGS